MISPCTDEGVKPELGGIEWKVGWQLEMNWHHLFLPSLLLLLFYAFLFNKFLRTGLGTWLED